MNITRQRKAVDTPLAWRKMLADYPNGGSIKVSEIRTSILYDGTPVYYSATDNLWHVIINAVMQANAGSTATKYKVLKGNNLKVGDYLYNGSTGYAITDIDATNASYDEVTVGTTLGAASAGAVLTVGSSSAAAPAPQGLVFGHHVITENMNTDIPVGVIGTVNTACMPTELSSTQKAALTGIVFV